DSSCAWSRVTFPSTHLCGAPQLAPPHPDVGSDARARSRSSTVRCPALAAKRAAAKLPVSLVGNSRKHLQTIDCLSTTRRAQSDDSSLTTLSEGRAGISEV